jgi:APA family basic amino acid/polyamine antiporter
MTGPGPGGGRAIGPWGAAGVGLGAIVGGGVLALGGVAFASAGPAAVLAFALNGLIALVTALSFCEMSTRFPESGGTYTFAKKVLSVQSAFTLGWVVWFASIVAAALYALGFALFAGAALEVLGNAVTAGGAPSWLTGRPAMAALAAGAAIFYAVKLVRRSSGGGHWETIGKVIVFAVLIAGGLWVTARRPVEEVVAALRPFFPSGAAGVFRAMGYAFIAFQGFDLIAAVAGEIREPTRTIPRAMLASIGASLAIYLPLLFVVTCAGVPAGTAIDEAAADRPGTLMVEAVQHFMGPAGFWLVIVAAILSMLSALKANLLAASRVATAMAQDRTLPGFLGTLDPKRRTPVAAILACTALVIAIVAAVPDVAAAGAAASLIFLVSFTTVHWTAILARRRSTDVRTPFHAPLFPLVPVAGIAACGALAVFQGVTVPLAGFIAGIWLFAGIIIYAFLLSRRARLFDASVEGYQPDLVHMRGKNPLVLVPIANPASATAMVAVASALAPLGAGRVVLLSVIRPPVRWQPSEPPPALHNAQELLGRILSSSFASGVAPEALITVAQHPWEEIARVARTYGCESLLLGLSSRAEGSRT